MCWDLFMKTNFETVKKKQCNRKNKADRYKVKEQKKIYFFLYTKTANHQGSNKQTNKSNKTTAADDRKW